MLFYLLFFAYSYFSLPLVDVLQLGIWREANSLVDPSLRKLIPNLLHLQLESRAPSTLQKYRSGWLKWTRQLLSIENPDYCTLIGRRKCFWWWHKSLSSSSLGAWQRRYQKGSHCFTVTERVLHPSQERDLQLRWNYKDADHLWCLSLSDTQFTVTERLSVPRACTVKQTIGRSNSAERLPSCPGRRD